MLSTMNQIFAILIGVVGEAIMIRIVAKIQLWWEVEVSEEMKAKVEVSYDALYKDSQSQGQPDDQDSSTPPPK